MSQESIQKLRIWIREQGLDAFLVSQPQNRTYLSGWAEDDPEAGTLLIGPDHLFLLTNPLYAGGGKVLVDDIIPTYAPAADNNDEQGYINSLKHAADTWRSGTTSVR